MHEGPPAALPRAIRTVPMHNIDPTIPFFDSLRESYAEFDGWYSRVAQEGREAWIVSHDSGAFGGLVAPRALVIYKEESDPALDEGTIPGKGLKLSTFKVGEEIRGRKIGELFLKTAMAHAQRRGLAFVFVTMRPEKREHNHLEDLCVDFGFQKRGTYQGDNVFVKEQPSSPPPIGELDALEYHRRRYPFFFAGDGVGKFMVPIRPEYHDILFPEAQSQLSLDAFPPGSAGNAIKKAYLCRAQIRQIKPGGILLFYRSGDRQAVATVGVVERAEIMTNCDDIMSVVSKRTVYSYNEVKQVFGEGATLVLLFRVARHLEKNEVGYERLKELGVVSGPIQSIQEIRHPKFLEIANEARFRDCFCVD